MNPPITLTLTLQVDGESLIGSATDDRGDRREFAGWLGLIAALDSILRTAPSFEPAQPAGRPETPSREPRKQSEPTPPMRRLSP
jgi:hypothetical protein